MATLSRRDFLATAAVAAAASQMPTARAAARRPNLLVLLTDDQRWDSLGCMGNDIIQTPHIDRLAAEGVRFNNCFSTTAICMASRASIFTGMYTTTHGIDDFAKPLPPEVSALSYPELLRDAGYYIGFVGKYGIGGKLPEDSYDYWDGFPGQGKYFQEVDGKTRHLTQMLGESACEALQSMPEDKPFCLSVSFKAPHVQDEDPRQYLFDPALEALYQDVEIPVPMTADPKYFDRLPSFIQESEGRKRWNIRFASPEMYQTSVKGYYRLVTGVDRAVGQIMACLEAQGLLDNTVVIFTSDQGIMNGEHGLAGKWLMYEESIRMPLIIRDPRMPETRRGTALEAMALNLDISPTLLDLAGIETPSVVQGESLAPFLGDSAPPAGWRTEWFYEHHFGSKNRPVPIPANEGVRTDDWKYVRYVDSEPLYEELFHVRSDALEQANLATSPEHTEILEEMRGKWSAWREKIKPLG